MTRSHASAHPKLDPTSREEELRAVYYSMVELITQGKYEETAKALSSLRDRTGTPDRQCEALRRLIAVRLAIKRGDPGENTAWVQQNFPPDSWLEAEKFLVQGHWEYHLKHFEEGIRCFLKAESIFERLKMPDRELVSAFNALIGEISGPRQLDPRTQLDRLRQLEIRVRPHVDIRGCAQVQALIHRQKAHAFEDLNRFHASLEEISKAIPIFEIFGPASDYHLAVLHAADILLDLGDALRARGFTEYVFEPVDARVEFPLAFIRWRLGGPRPECDRFTVVPGGWKEKFEKLSCADSRPVTSPQSEWTWSPATGELKSPDGSICGTPPPVQPGRPRTETALGREIHQTPADRSPLAFSRRNPAARQPAPSLDLSTE